MNIPDYLPVLSSGGHVSPESGACLMEMIAFLNGEQHSDTPMCVSSVLVPLGINANDFLSDHNRSALVPLIPDFMNTNDLDAKVLKDRVQQEVFPEFYNWYQGDNAKRTFSYLSSCDSKDFLMSDVIFMISKLYASPEYNKNGQVTEAIADEAVLDYVNRVLAIVRDMKPAETVVDISVGINHPSQKANV